jgi:hypothetical protein
MAVFMAWCLVKKNDSFMFTLNGKFLGKVKYKGCPCALLSTTPWRCIGGGGIVPLILDLGTGRRWVVRCYKNYTHTVKFIHLLLYISSCLNNGLLQYSTQIYEGVSKSFRTGRLERELQMIQLCATRYSCIAILWVNLVSFAAITLHVASQRVLIVVSIYFVIDSVRKFLDTPSYV